MDDKELIKRIMEEVKDEKLREELLKRVAKEEGNGVKIEKEKLEKMMEELKDLKYAGKIAKVQWYSMWVGLIVFGIIVGLPIVASLIPTVTVENLIPTVGVLSLIVIAILIILYGGKPAEPVTKDDNQIK
uniref:Uncharacterized protein n=1 Tax=Thermocrinis ruber TaxID=75906 RepID=A0A7C5X428_9AQUI